MNSEERFKCSFIRFGAAICLAVFFLIALLSPLWAQAKGDWKQTWETVLREAKKEGKVVVFGPPGEVVRKAIVEGFTQAFPDIRIEYSGARGSDHVAKIRAERDAGIYSVDVFNGNNLVANFNLRPIGALDPLRPALILPEVADLKHWHDGRLEFSDSAALHHLVFTSTIFPLLMYNLQQVKPEEIAGPNDLLNPKWKGRIVINDPLLPSAAYVIFQWLWRVLGSEKATDYYRKIRAQAGAVDRDYRRQIEWVAQGKYAILLGPSSLMFQLAKRGLNFGVIPEFKDMGAYVSDSFGGVSLMNRAPHPNAGKVFINWLLGKAGQTAWSKAMEQVSRRADVPSDHVPSYMAPKPGARYWVSDYKSGDRYWVSYAENTSKRTKEEEKILAELFGR